MFYADTNLDIPKQITKTRLHQGQYIVAEVLFIACYFLRYINVSMDMTAKAQLIGRVPAARSAKR